MFPALWLPLPDETSSRTGVDNPPNGPAICNVLLVPRQFRPAWLFLLPALTGSHWLHPLPDGTRVVGRPCVVPPIWPDDGIKHLSILIPKSHTTELRHFGGCKCHQLRPSLHSQRRRRWLHKFSDSTSNCRCATVSIKSASGDPTKSYISARGGSPS